MTKNDCSILKELSKKKKVCGWGAPKARSVHSDPLWRRLPSLLYTHFFMRAVVGKRSLNLGVKVPRTPPPTGAPEGNCCQQVSFCPRALIILGQHLNDCDAFVGGTCVVWAGLLDTCHQSAGHVALVKLAAPAFWHLGSPPGRLS